MPLIRNLSNPSEWGLVIDWKFHLKNSWVCALTPYLIENIVREFNPLIITSQFEYSLYKKKIKYLISTEPGWAAPFIKYDTSVSCQKAVFYSDPHYNTHVRRQYFDENGFDFVFSQYYYPFFYHFKNFPKEKFVHMPWAIPDHFLSTKPLQTRNNQVVIFGASGSSAYDVRNWCRMQPDIVNYEFSGVENKKMTDRDYFDWLMQFDAIVAAGSSDPQFDLVTPKYFEIASSGALLIGQQCNDLPLLGFNEQNSLIFIQSNFNEKIHEYRDNPHNYLKLRNNGRQLIRNRHKISDRIKLIKRTFEDGF